MKMNEKYTLAYDALKDYFTDNLQIDNYNMIILPDKNISKNLIEVFNNSNGKMIDTFIKYNYLEKKFNFRTLTLLNNDDNENAIENSFNDLSSLMNFINKTLQ